MNRAPRIFLLLSTLALTTALGCKSAAYDPTADKAAINASLQSMTAAVDAKDLNGVMAYYAPDVFAYDVITPRQYVGAAYRKDWQELLDLYSGPIQTTVSDWTIDTDGTFAYAHGTFRMVGTYKLTGKLEDMTVRVTDVFKKIDGKWLVVHEHVSYPVDPVTMKPDIDSKL
jgi:ketosteroid isomerase-like protein